MICKPAQAISVNTAERDREKEGERKSGPRSGPRARLIVTRVSSGRIRVYAVRARKNNGGAEQMANKCVCACDADRWKKSCLSKGKKAGPVDTTWRARRAGISLVRASAFDRVRCTRYTSQLHNRTDFDYDPFEERRRKSVNCRLIVSCVKRFLWPKCFRVIRSMPRARQEKKEHTIDR